MSKIVKWLKVGLIAINLTLKLYAVSKNLNAFFFSDFPDLLTSIYIISDNIRVNKKDYNTILHKLSLFVIFVICFSYKYLQFDKIIHTYKYFVNQRFTFYNSEKKMKKKKFLELKYVSQSLIV